VLSREQVAEALHDAYEEAAAKHGWSTQQASRKPWSDVPEANKATMLEAIDVALMPLFDVARNEALEEAALSIRNYFGDYDRQRIRALKSGGGGSSG
jgi:hypothetical protein